MPARRLVGHFFFFFILSHDIYSPKWSHEFHRTTAAAVPQHTPTKTPASIYTQSRRGSHRGASSSSQTGGLFHTARKRSLLLVVNGTARRREYRFVFFWHEATSTASSTDRHRLQGLNRNNNSSPSSNQQQRRAPARSWIILVRMDRGDRVRGDSLGFSRALTHRHSSSMKGLIGETRRRSTPHPWCLVELSWSSRCSCLPLAAVCAGIYIASRVGLTAVISVILYMFEVLRSYSSI